MSVEIQIVKSILMRSQMKIVLLIALKGGEILVSKWQIQNKSKRNFTDLCSCPSVLWKINLQVIIKYLAEKISKQSVKGATSFLLTTN